jgi:hypothetical protein
MHTILWKYIKNAVIPATCFGHSCGHPQRGALRRIYSFFATQRSVVNLSTRRQGVSPRSVHVRFVVDKVSMGHVFLPVLGFYPCQYHSTKAPRLFSSRYWYCQKDKRAKTGNLPKRNSVSEIGENCIEVCSLSLQRVNRLVYDDQKMYWHMVGHSTDGFKLQ